MSISQRLQVLSDDLPQTMRIAGILKKLGMKSRIIEPKDNPAFADQDIDELKKSNDLWEVVEAYNKHLAVTIYVTMDAGLSAEIGAYQRYLFNEDMWPWLIVQLKSTRPQKITNLVNIIKQLLPLAEDVKALAAKLIELNKTLHWYKSARVKKDVQSSNLRQGVYSND